MELRIELLGAFRVGVGDRAVSDAAWQRKKPAALIKLLALAPGHRLHRAQLIDALWPALDATAGGANLRKAVYEARRALDQVDGIDLISSDADFVCLPREGLKIDIDAFHASVAAARRDADLNEYQRAVDLYGAGLLPEDRYEEWAVEARDALRLEYLEILAELAGLLESRGVIDQAIRVARQLVAAEPLREDNHVALIRLNALAGRRGDALHAYQRLRATLADELGAEPGAAVQQLYEQIRSREVMEPELAADLWERVGDLRMVSGDAVGAVRAFGTALDSADGSEARGRLERKTADAWLMRHRPDRAAEHLAAAEVSPIDGAERARLLRSRANQAWESGDIASAQSYAERARAAALEDGTPDDVAAAHEALAVVSHFRGEWRDGLAAELGRLAFEGAGAASLARVFDIHHCIGQYHLYGDGLADSVEGYARRILERAENAGAVRAEAFAWCLLGESLLLQARWDESVGCLERSCDLHAGLGSRSGALAWQRRAELAVCCGAPEEAETYLRRASAIATVSAMACHLWGRIYATRAFCAVETDEPERAVAAVRAAAAASARNGDCPSCSALLNPIATEAFAVLGDLEGARAYAASAQRVGQMFASSAWQAMAESAAASLALAEGDEVAAHTRFEAARALYLRAGQPYWADRVTRGNAPGTRRS